MNKLRGGKRKLIWFLVPSTFETLGTYCDPEGRFEFRLIEVGDGYRVSGAVTLREGIIRLDLGLITGRDAEKKSMEFCQYVFESLLGLSIDSIQSCGFHCEVLKG